MKLARFAKFNIGIPPSPVILTGILKTPPLFIFPESCKYDPPYSANSFYNYPYRLHPPTTPSSAPFQFSISPTALRLSFPACLKSVSRRAMRSSCSAALFSTPGSTEMRYAIWEVLIRRSHASSCVAAGR